MQYIETLHNAMNLQCLWCRFAEIPEDLELATSCGLRAARGATRAAAVSLPDSLATLQVMVACLASLRWTRIPMGTLQEEATPVRSEGLGRSAVH